MALIKELKALLRLTELQALWLGALCRQSADKF